MIEKIKKNLRITHSKLDDEIEDCISACLRDLERVGLKDVDNKKNDHLILQCVKLYSRWQFNFENQAERYRQSYESLRNALSLNKDYI